MSERRVGAVEPLANDWRGDGGVVEAPLRPQEGLGCCEKILFWFFLEKKEHRSKDRKKLWFFKRTTKYLVFIKKDATFANGNYSPTTNTQ